MQTVGQQLIIAAIPLSRRWSSSCWSSGRLLKENAQYVAILGVTSRWSSRSSRSFVAGIIPGGGRPSSSP